jgi:DNA adenine methylase
MALLRYPGGKSKLQKHIVPSLRQLAANGDFQYREPFFGGGAIGLRLLEGDPERSALWLNDKDPGIACLWTAVLRFPAALQARIAEFQPSVAAFDEMKAALLAATAFPDTQEGILSLGFQKLALHQISYSGLGTRSGGPLGSRGQNSRYKIDSRWSPQRLCPQIDKYHRLFAASDVHSGGCTCLDFADVITDDSRRAILYLDPPYYHKGDALYQVGLSTADHARLAALLRTTPHPWVLSYDDCPEVRQLYDWAMVGAVPVTYSLAGARHRRELLIVPPPLPQPSTPLREFWSGMAAMVTADQPIPSVRVGPVGQEHWDGTRPLTGLTPRTALVPEPAGMRAETSREALWQLTQA